MSGPLLHDVLYISAKPFYCLRLILMSSASMCNVIAQRKADFKWNHCVVWMEESIIADVDAFLCINAMPYIYTDAHCMLMLHTFWSWCQTLLFANVGISVHFIGDGPSNTLCLYQCPCCRSHDTWLSWFIDSLLQLQVRIKVMAEIQIFFGHYWGIISQMWLYSS